MRQWSSQQLDFVNEHVEDGLKAPWTVMKFIQAARACHSRTVLGHSSDYYLGARSPSILHA